jgi:hypothetical protein
MTRAFTFPGLTTRVIFGAGTLAQVADEVQRLGHARALILSTPHQADQAQSLADTLGPLTAGVFAGAAMHTPTDVTETAVAAFTDSGATCVISLGGGSTTGLGKAIAVRTGADQLVIPTTYAGSEMTDILGETASGEKTTRRDPAIRPEVVIYDVNLTLSLPVTLTMTSALNAIAHAMEAFYAPDRNPVIEAMCRDAMRASTVTRGPRRSMPRGAAPPLWGRSAWPCITSWPMCWAGLSGCRMQKPTPCCFPIPLPSMQWRRPHFCPRSPTSSAPPPVPGCGISPLASARPSASLISVLRNPTLTAPPT